MGGSRTPSECGEHRGADSSGGGRSGAAGGGEALVKSATSSVRGQPDAHSVASLESGEGDGSTVGAAAGGAVGSGWGANSALARKDTLTVQAALHYRRASAQLAGGCGTQVSRTQSAAEDEAASACASVCASVCSSTRARTVTSDQICEAAKQSSEKCSPSQSVAGSGPLGRDRDSFSQHAATGGPRGTAPATVGCSSRRSSSARSQSSLARIRDELLLSDTAQSSASETAATREAQRSTSTALAIRDRAEALRSNSGLASVPHPPAGARLSHPHTSTRARPPQSQSPVLESASSASASSDADTTSAGAPSAPTSPSRPHTPSSQSHGSHSVGERDEEKPEAAVGATMQQKCIPSARSSSSNLPQKPCSDEEERVYYV